MKWHEGRLVGYDLESTGTDPLEARIVTAAIVYVAPGERPRSIEWLLDPGVEIPAEAAAVHGWTRTRILDQIRQAGDNGRGFNPEGKAVRLVRSARELGKPNLLVMEADGALGEIVGHVGTAMHTDTPLAIANATNDLTLTETECARLGIDPLMSRPAGIRGVVDPMVTEKAYDPFRKVKGGCRGGKHRCGGCGVTDKKLGSLCLHYGVRLTGAHNASADALAAIRLAVKLADLWPEVARWKLGTLHAHQMTWRREQADSLRAYFDRAGTEHDGVDPGWPVHTSLTSLAPSTPAGAPA